MSEELNEGTEFVGQAREPIIYTPGGSGRPDTSNVYVPTVKESLQIELLDTNLTQTEDYIKQFSDEKEKLGETYNECVTVLQAEFEKLREMLSTREELLLKQLELRFKERDEKLEKQLSDLQNHSNDNENIDQECKELLATMTERRQKGERTIKITQLCQDCIKRSPLLQEVPIDLMHKFKTQKTIMNTILEYGELKCKRVELGKTRKFKTKKHDIISQEYNVGDSVPTHPNSRSSRVGSSSSNVKSNLNGTRAIDDEKLAELESTNGNGNNNNNNNNSSAKPDIQIPDRIKVTCCVIAKEQTKDKQIVLRKSKNDYTLKKIKDTIEKLPIIRPYVKDIGSDKINWKYSLTENGESIKDITNNDDFLQDVVLATDPDARVGVCIKAEMVIDE